MLGQLPWNTRCHKEWNVMLGKLLPWNRRRHKECNVMLGQPPWNRGHHKEWNVMLGHCCHGIEDITRSGM